MPHPQLNDIVPIATPAAGILFADEREKVIYADTHLLQLLGYDSAGKVTGEAVNKVLGIDYQVTRDLLSAIQRSGQVQDWALSIQTQRYVVLQSTCNGSANVDHMGRFMGVDLIFSIVPTQKQAAAAQIQEADPVVQAKKLATQESYVQDTLALMPYFIVVVESVRAMVVLMIGNRYAEVLDSLLNETARRNNWAIYIEAGKCHIGSEQISLDAYRALLVKEMAYVIRIVGQDMITNQLQQINNKTAPKILELVRRVNLIREL